MAANDHRYEAGRRAGLREAARLVRSHPSKHVEAHEADIRECCRDMAEDIERLAHPDSAEGGAEDGG